MIRAGLATARIAQLLDVTSETVRTLRKRLRKRMGLGHEEDLEEVIAGVG